MQGPDKRKKRLWYTIFFLVAVFAVALTIRLIGLDFGKPLLVHPDEENVVHSALKYSSKYQYEHITFNRPAQIQSALTRVSMSLFSKIRFQKDLDDVFYLYQLSFYRVARLLVAILGSFMPIVAYFIGREFDPDISVFSALAFAFFPSFVKHSHYATPDIPLTLWLMLAMLFCIYYAKGAKPWALCLALFFCAVSTADKYPGIIGLIMVATAVLIRFMDKAKQEGKFDGKGFVLTGILCFVLFFAFLFMVAPFLFIKFKSVIDALIFEGTGGHLGRDGLSYPHRVFTFLGYYFTESGWLFGGFTLLGLFFLVRSKLQSAFILLFSLVFLLAIATIGPHHERWALPVYLGLIFCMAFGMASLLNLTKEKHTLAGLCQAGIIVSFSLFAISGLSQSLWLNLRDTRTVGLNFLLEQKIDKDVCYYDGYTPFAPNFFPLDSEQDLARKEEMNYAIFSSYYFQRFENLDESEYEELRYFKEKQQTGVLIWSIKGQENPKSLKNQWTLFKYYFQTRIQNQNQEPLYTGPDLYIYNLKSGN